MVNDTATHTRARGLASIFALALALLVAVGSDAGAEELSRPPIHVQIVLDSSGSMENSDPRRLSALAGMIFTDLAGPDDHVGILSMRKGQFVEEELSQTQRKRKGLRRTVRELPFVGSTFCAEPLELAADGLTKLRKEQPDASQFVIFLSDGACPNDHQRGPQDIRDAAARLSTDGVRIFSIGLFGAPPLDGSDPASDLRTMASVTDGQFSRVSRAADLPKQFADILGRIVGSQAQQVTLAAGQDSSVIMDGYVYDASFIATGSGKPVVIDKAAGPDDASLPLPRRSEHSETSQGFYVAAFGNGAGRHYSVLRIDEPAPGKWTFRVDGPGDLTGLLIQNYALDPVVELGKTQSTYAMGDEVEATAWLRGKDGSKIDDANFLQKVEFTLAIEDPNGKERTLTLEPSKSGQFSGLVKLDVGGKWAVRGRARLKTGGLDKRTDRVPFDVIAATLALADGQGPIDLGDVKAGTRTDPQTIDLGASKLPREIEVDLELQGMSGIDATPGSFKAGPDSKTASVSFTVGAEHPGGTLDGELVLSIANSRVAVPVTVNIIPLTFWERWGRLVIVIGAGLLGLGLLIFIVLGFVRPHRFPPDSRINWGESMDRLGKNELVISEMRGTGTGFYRNAELVVGGPGSPLAVGGAVVAVIWMDGPSQIKIRSESGLELRKVNKFDSKKTNPVDGNECALHTGEIYQIGELFLRLK